MTRVLLINSDRAEASHRLAADPEVDLCVITKPKYAALYEGATVARVSDVADLTEVRDAALRLTRGGWFDAVVSPLERGLLAAGMVRSQLGIRGLTFDQSLGFASKLIMKRRARQAGIMTAPFRAVPDVAAVIDAGEELGWPVVVKPAVGAGARNTLRIGGPARARAALRDDPSLAALADQPSPVLVERALDVRTEFHCDGVVRDGEVAFVSVARYLTPVLDCFGGFIGSVILARSDPAHQAVAALHERVVAVLGLRDGVTHLEAFDTPDGLVFGEVTCRPGGGGILRAVQRKFGIDLWDAFTDLHLGREPRMGGPALDTTVGWVGLPARNGKVLELTTAGELREIPGVDEVEMKYAAGDVIDEKMTSVFMAGTVHVSGTDESQIDNAIAKVKGVYKIQTADFILPAHEKETEDAAAR